MQMGAMIWTLILLYGMSRVLRRINDPEWSSKAAVALVLSYSLLLVLTLAGAMPSPTVSMVAAGLCMLVTPATLVLAILGWLDLRRAGGPPRGLNYVVWSMLLASIPLATVGAGFWKGIANRAPDEMSAYLLPVQPGAGEVISFDTTNYRLRAPEGWKRLDARRVHKDASLAFGEPSTQTFAIVIAEESDGVDTDSITRTWRAHMEGPGGTVTGSEPFRNHGLDGRRLQATLQRGLLTFHYTAWVAARNGYVYQVVIWSTTDKTLAAKAAQFIDAFEQTDPRRESGKLSKPVGPHRSDLFGYAIDAGPQWRQWRDRLARFPSSDFGALCDDSDGLVVIALSLEGESLPIAMVADGMLDRAGLPSNSTTRKHTPVAIPGYQAMDSEQILQRDGIPWRYRARAVRGGDLALTAVTWTSRAAGVSSTCEGVIEKLKLDPVPPRLRPQATPGPSSLFFNQLGMAAYDAKDWDGAVRWYRRAQSLNSADDHFALNEADALRVAGRPEEALAAIDRALQQGRTRQVFPALRARLLSQLGRVAEAHAAWDGLFHGGYDDAEALEMYARSLEAHDQLGKAIEVVDDFGKRHDSARAVILESRLLERKGDPARAVELLRARRSKAGFEVDVAYRLGYAELKTSQFNVVLEEADDIAARGYESVDSHLLKARAMMGLRWYPRARTELETTLQKYPSDEDARKLRDNVLGILGQGDNSSVREPIAAVELPPDLATAAEASQGDAHATYLLRSVAFAFTKGEPLRRSDVRVVSVGDQTGVEAFSTFEFQFDPLSESIYLNQIEVRDAEGHVVPGKPEDAYVLDARENEASQRKALFVPVQGLRPGSRVKVQVTRRDLASTETMRFVSEPMIASYPVAHGVVAVTGNVDAVKAVTAHGVKEVTRPGLHAFLADGVAARQRETLVPVLSDYAPMVQLGDRSADWGRKGKEYLEEIAERLKKIDPEVEAAARAHGGSAPKLAAFVQRELTYRAIEFGRSARVPHPAAEVLKNRAGDCKDHALLLHQMLKSAGIPSSLALVRTTGKIVPDLPSTDQFNHMVVYLPGTPPSFIDTTQKYDDPALGFARDQAGNSALVLDATPHLVEIPDAGKPQSLAVTREMQVSGSDLLVRERVELTGAAAAWIREVLDRAEEGSRSAALQRTLSYDGQARVVTSVEATNLHDFSKPLLVTLSYRQSGGVRETAGQLVGRLPAPWEHRWLAPLGDGKRKSPARFPLALHLTSVSQLAAPKLGELAPLQSAGAAADGPQWKVTAAPERISLSFDRPAIYLEPATAERWQASEVAALAAAEQNFVVRLPQREAAR